MEIKIRSDGFVLKGKLFEIRKWLKEMVEREEELRRR